MSRCCAGAGASGYAAASECRKVHVWRPSVSTSGGQSGGRVSGGGGGWSGGADEEDEEEEKEVVGLAVLLRWASAAVWMLVPVVVGLGLLGALRFWRFMAAHAAKEVHDRHLLFFFPPSFSIKETNKARARKV